MNVRQAMTEDVAEIRALVVSLSGFYLSDPHAAPPRWLTETLTVEQFGSRLGSTDFVNRVALVGGELVGYVCMKKNGHLYHLFVSEQHQGKGIARALWGSMLECCKCSTYTVRSSLYAVPMYKRLGFVETGPVAEQEGVQFQTMELANAVN